MNTKGAIKKIKESTANITPENVLITAARLPGVKINREKFLKKELKGKYPQKVIETAISHNLAYAGIPLKDIDAISKHVINYETNKTSATSFVAGLPGGEAMIATVPADIAQYFGFILRIMQELAYLYGFEEFDLKEDEMSSETLNQLLVFLGVMFGVQEANAAVKVLGKTLAQKVSKNLANKALTKTAYYPLLKETLAKVGVKITKQIFADSVAKIVPLIGGVINGTLTFATFKHQCIRLKKSFRSLPICKPEFYEAYEDDV